MVGVGRLGRDPRLAAGPGHPRPAWSGVAAAPPVSVLRVALLLPPLREVPQLLLGLPIDGPIPAAVRTEGRFAPGSWAQPPPGPPSIPFQLQRDPGLKGGAQRGQAVVQTCSTRELRVLGNRQEGPAGDKGCSPRTLAPTGALP